MHRPDRRSPGAWRSHLAELSDILFQSTNGDHEAVEICLLQGHKNERIERSEDCFLAVSETLRNFPTRAEGWQLALRSLSRYKGKAAPRAMVFGASEHAQAVAFVASGNSDENQRNLYFLPNAEFLKGARKKENISAVRFLHVDLDYKDYFGDETARKEHVIDILHEDKKRPKGIPKPTAIWFTGGGCQAVWKLDEPLSIEKAEELNKTLLFILQGGQGTKNADRLLRLPWTMNWLSDKKRADGREPALSWVFEPMDWTRRLAPIR